MALTPPIWSTALIPTQAFRGSRHQFLILRDHKTSQQLKRKKNPTTPSFIIQAAAAKLPPGVEPKFKAPFLGFTTTTEDWNSRVCMIVLVGIFIIELSVKYCCTGEYANPKACKPTLFAHLFKAICPKAYSYPFDDVSSLNKCRAPRYVIIFCPLK